MSNIEHLQGDVDARLVELWALIWGEDAMGYSRTSEATQKTLAECLRTAYSIGYRDALVEDRAGARGELYTAHGYATP